MGNYELRELDRRSARQVGHRVRYGWRCRESRRVRRAVHKRSRCDPAIIEPAGLQEFNKERELTEHRHARCMIELDVQFANGGVEH